MPEFTREVHSKFRYVIEMSDRKNTQKHTFGVQTYLLASTWPPTYCFPISSPLLQTSYIKTIIFLKDTFYHLCIKNILTKKVMMLLPM